MRKESSRVVTVTRGQRCFVLSEYTWKNEREENLFLSIHPSDNKDGEKEKNKACLLLQIEQMK